MVSTDDMRTNFSLCNLAAVRPPTLTVTPTFPIAYVGLQMDYELHNETLRNRIFILALAQDYQTAYRDG